MAQLSLLHLLSPKIQEKPPICSICQCRFQLLGSKCCVVCHREMNAEGNAIDTKKLLCSDCHQWHRFYRGNVLKNTAVYQYNQAFHDLMVAYKRYGDYVLSQVLRFMIQKPLLVDSFDYYVPIPTSPEHFAQRGFDTIASIYAPIVPLSKVLVKKANTQPQGEKNKKARMQTPQSFVVRKNQVLSGRILLLDDIYTTGRTLYHARDALLQAYPKLCIQSFTISR